ncbi:MAG: MlaD family protein [Syntrophales bacterium]|nr:MlaD family protein [Syntrophales bacterium]
MIQRKYETVVGIFVVASLAALLVMVVIIAQQERLWEEHVKYTTIFKDVSGLKVGSEVRLAGVTVGNVKEMTIDPQGQIIVTFEVVGKYRNQIRQDSRATIGFQGLLGDKSLDLSAGSPSQPEIAAGGTVSSIEPFDITKIITEASPIMGDVKKLLTNLLTLTEAMNKPGGDFNRSLNELRQIVTKINKGKGTVGKLLNDPVLYRESAQAATSIRKFADSLDKNKGALDTLLKDPAFKEDLRKTMANLGEASSRLPGLMKKAEAFVEQLQRAGKGLPGLVTSGETMVSDVDKAAKAAQKSWLLRRHVPKTKERTLRLE